MTLIVYNADKLNDLALRVLDLSAVFRGMALRAQQGEAPDIELHDKKAMEWFAKFEYWTHEAAQKFELQAIQNKGAAKAKEIAKRAGAM